MRWSASFTFLLIEALAFGQGFNRRYDAFSWGDPQGGWNIEYTDTGYTVISGMTNTDSLGPNLFLTHGSVLVTFLDANGTKLGEQRSYRPFHTSTAGWANCCDTIPGGGYVAGGASEDTLGNDEVYLMRFDALGDTLWTKVFGDPLLNYYYIGRQVKRTVDGGFLVVGDTDQGGPVRGFAIRTDESGNELWRMFYSWGGAWNDAFLSAGLGANGDLFMAGTRNLSFTDNEFWLQRTDSLGNVRWSVSWGGPYDEGACQITVLDDGHLLNFSGIGHGPNYQPSRVYMAKLDSANGSIIWEREYGQAAPNTLLLAGKECPNGDLIGAGGSFVSTGPNNDKGVLLRTTSTGDSLWMFTYHYQDSIISNGQGRFYDVLPTADGGFIAAGVARNPVGGPYPPGYSQDTWVVKVDSMGCIVPGCNSVGIAEQVTNLSEAITLWPNPTSTQATVLLDLPEKYRSDLRLSVVNAQGQLVQEQGATLGRNELHVQGFPPGLYHVHVAQGDIWLGGIKLVVE